MGLDAAIVSKPSFEAEKLDLLLETAIAEKPVKYSPAFVAGTALALVDWHMLAASGLPWQVDECLLRAALDHVRHGKL